uniref:Mitochondrial glycoprotein n=1 Tax=Leersia perrieri TaxID=77586 RepID=A0A0D9XNX3_9ORYZ
MLLLRRLATSAFRRGANDGGVLAAVRAEIAHELSSSSPSPSLSLSNPRYPPSHSPPIQRRYLIPPLWFSQDIPDFTTVSDAPRGQEVILRRRDASEEVLVSALLAPLQFQGGEEPLPSPRDALMKVFVSKPGVKPVLQFDCRAFEGEGDGDAAAAADYDVTAVRYHSFAGDAGGDKYEGPEFRVLDPQLQVALKVHLLARGVNSKLASSLLHHLVEKERWQYVNWLKTSEEIFSKDH